MNETDAWKNFINSGSIADYLKYASIKNGSVTDEYKASEERNENQHGRTGYQGTEYQGTGQINNGFNKK